MYSHDITGSQRTHGVQFQGATGTQTSSRINLAEKSTGEIEKSTTGAKSSATHKKTSISKKMELLSLGRTFGTAIKKNEAKIQELQKGINHREGVIGNQYTGTTHRDNLIAYNDGAKQTIKRLEAENQIFRNIDFKFFRNDRKTVKEVRAGISELSKDKISETSFMAGKKVYVVNTNDQGHYEISKMKHKIDLLGRGGFGIVYTAKTLESSDTKVIKLSTTKGSRAESAKKQIINEEKMLKKIGKVSGIQRAPRMLIKFFDKKGIEQTGILGKKYDGDGIDLAGKQLTTKEKITTTRNILFGKQHLKNERIYHGDIKPENMLFKQKKNGEYDLVLADFGGARFIEEILKPNGKVFIPPANPLGYYFDAHTPTYVSELVSDAILAVHEQMLEISKKVPIDQKLLEEKNNEIGTLLEINDDYATALSLTIMWTGKDTFAFTPYLNSLHSESDSNDIASVEGMINKTLTGMPDDMKKTISEMLIKTATATHST